MENQHSAFLSKPNLIISTIKKKTPASFNGMLPKLAVSFLFLIFLATSSIAQNCTVNAGIDQEQCVSTATLTGSVGGDVDGGTQPQWTFVSGPATPNIVSPNTLITDVTDMTAGGDYVFRLSRICQNTIESSQEVTISAYPNDTFTAGSNINGGCHTLGEATFTDAVIPVGFTGVWTVNLQPNSAANNITIDDNTIANPTVSLINKVNPTEKPHYVFKLTITSTNGLCTYTDTKTVIFSPDVVIEINNNSACAANRTTISNGAHLIPLATNPGYTAVLNVISQPVGGAMALSELNRNNIIFSGTGEVGDYVYTITLTSAACGITHTTQPATLTNVGYAPTANPLPAGYPNQLSYGSNNSYQHICGPYSNTISAFVEVPNDPAIVFTAKERTSVLPIGASEPTFTIVPYAGSGIRELQVTSGDATWVPGTYQYRYRVDNGGGCLSWFRSFTFHISDNNRTNLVVDDVTSCDINNLGIATATITLPPKFIETPDPAYLSTIHTGNAYEIKNITKPAGAGNVGIPQVNLSTTDGTLTMTNFTKPGAYTFTIDYKSGIYTILEAEYACSGASTLDTFIVTIEESIDANAGTDQVFSCSSSNSLVGNDPGTSLSEWTLVSKPSGATDPRLVTPYAKETLIAAVGTAGDYTYQYTVSSPAGDCISTDQVVVTFTEAAPILEASSTIESCALGDGTITAVASDGDGGPYTYTLTDLSTSIETTNGSGLFTGLSAGDYTVTSLGAISICVSDTTYVSVLGAEDIDEDGIRDLCDLDDDNDGILDYKEVCGGSATDFSCLTGCTDCDPSADDDGDGILNYKDADFCTLNVHGVCASMDFDSDGIPDYLDIDADNDGIVDNTEAQSTLAYIAPTGYDDDGDGLDNAYDIDCAGGCTNSDGTTMDVTGVTIVPVNTDGQDLPDYTDLDTDNDGISDLIEGHDTNGDGAVNGSDSPLANTGLAGGTTDADGDGLLDGFDNDVANSEPTNGNLNAASHPDVLDGTAERDWRDIYNNTLAENDISQTPVNITVAGNILTNDTDTQDDNQTVQSATYLDILGASQNLTFATPTDIYEAANVLAGAITLNTDGTYSFVPATNYTGTVSVEYVAVDDNQSPKTDAAILTIEVLGDPINDGSNNPPVAQDDTNTTEQGVTITNNILINDSDVDGDVLTVTTATGIGLASSVVTLTITPTDVYDVNNVLAGQASIDGSGNVIFTAAANFVGEVPVEYTITDSNGGTDDATFIITVEAFNVDNDTYANDDANIGVKEQILSGNILDNDIDPEMDTQNITAATSNNGTTINIGTATALAGIGSLWLDTNGTYTFTPEINFIGTEPVAYQVCDNGIPVTCEMATLYLTILPYENSTQATNDYTNTPYDAQVTSTVLTNDRDLEGNAQTVNSMMVDSDGNGTPDLSKPLAMVTTVGGVNENGTANTNAGTLTQAADGKYTFIPTAGFVGVVTYSYVVCDNAIAQKCEPALVEIDVLPELNTSNSSVAASPDAFDTKLNTTINSNIIINDNDPEGGTYTVTDAMIDTDGDGIIDATLAIGIATTVAGKDEEGNPVANAGTLTLNTVGTMMFVPATGFTGTVTAEYEITDTDGDVDKAPLFIEIVTGELNNIFATDDSALTDAETPVSGNLVTNDNDPELDLFALTGLKVDTDGDGITDTDQSASLGGVTDITVGGVDKNGVAYADAGTLVMDYDGVYTFTPVAGFSGNVNVDYTICDAISPSACDVATLEISVLEVFRDYGDAPAIYPAAWHRAMADGNGDNVLDGANDVWLGSSTTFEASGSLDADVADDAITYGTATGNFPTAITPSATYDVDITVNSTSANTVYYGMWIDWDNNGTYEDFYSGSQATVGGAIATDASVTITAPTTYTGETVNTRLRVDDSALLATDFQGGKTNGEVEDFARAIALPVKLSSFEGKENGCSVDLTWKTESEDKFEYFEIEWSGDGKEFQAVDQIISIGNNGGGTYHYSDAKSSAHNYYRLKMVDLDGAFEYSSVVYTRVYCTELGDEVIAYPNPLSGEQFLTVQFSTMRNTEQMMITDRLGSVVRRMTLDTQFGKNTVQLDLSELPAGAYHLQIVGSRVAKTIVIQN